MFMTTLHVDVQSKQVEGDIQILISRDRRVDQLKDKVWCYRANGAPYTALRDNTNNMHQHDKAR